MRYLPLSDADRGEMLARIGVAAHRRPLRRRAGRQARSTAPLDLPRAQGRARGRAHPRPHGGAERRRPRSVPFFVGAGAYKHHVPASVDHLIQRSEFLTSYTPYQPEIAQGTLQYLFEFQTQVAALTGMEVANASMYDGSTGTAEAVLMAHRVTKRRKAVLSGGLHPHYAEVVRTLSAHGRRRGRDAAAGRDGGRGPSRRDRRRRLLRRRADARRLRQPARPARRSPRRRTGTARC